MNKKIEVGGQAVIEGVMMRSSDRIATAIRKNGKIKVKVEKINFLSKRYKIFRLPFLRGVISLFEMMYIGVKSLIYSANEFADEGEGEEALSKKEIILTMGTAFLFSLILFVGLPYGLTYLFGADELTQPILFNFVDGILKLAILVLYMYLIGRMEDVKTLFQYHGAEHMAVHTYEHKKELTYKNAKKYSPAHSRCGTSFIIIVILFGVVLFSFIPFIVEALFPQYLTYGYFQRLSILFGVRLLFLPLLAGISYEWLKFSAKIGKKSIFHVLIYPGMLVQRLTTREPTKEQLEVAFAALKGAVSED